MALRTLALTWGSYAAGYFLRKPIGVGKPALARALDLDSKSLGLLDVAMFSSYAGVQLFFGSVGDMLGARLSLTMVMLGSAASMLTFGAWNSLYFLCFLLFLNGAFQSLGWSTCIKALSQTVPESMRSKYVGIFSTSSFAGGVMGSALSVHLLARGGWRNMFVLPSLVVFTFGLLDYFLLPKPAAAGGGGDAEKAEAKGSSSEEGAGASKPLTIPQMLRIKLLPEAALAYLLVKLVRYAFYMWLPMYLHLQLDYTEEAAGLVAVTFEIGGVAGAAIVGFLLDSYFKGRDLVCAATYLALCTLSLVLFSLTSSWGLFFNCLFMIIAGAGNCGVDPVLSGTLSIKMANFYGESEGVPAPTAQLAGFINGLGSLGSIIEGVMIGLIADAYGWQAVFYTITALSLVTVAILIRAISVFGA